MKSGKIGFIGTGVMGGIIIRSIIASSVVDAKHISVFDIDREKALQLERETGVRLADNANLLAMESEYIFLCVKPQQLMGVLNEISGRLGENTILVSVAPGVSIGSIKKAAGGKARVVRTMPNTPAAVGEGMTIVSHEDSVTPEELGFVLKLLESFGKAEIFDEKLMDAVVALTGSSPAYVFMFIEAMGDAAVLSGIPRAAAYKLAAQAVLGSAKMVLETGKHPGELKDQVCSPSGTTIEAVYSLEKSGFRAAVIEAMKECTRRTKELSKLQ